MLLCMGTFYRFVRGLLRWGLRAFFREVETSGAENVPAEGPLLILANHHNGMIDPVLLMATTERPVTFVAKAALFKIPVLGSFVRGLHCMPVHRGQDAGYAKEKNQALYETAVSFLRAGRALGIFPEGKSHLDPALLEFKHGASRIAFDAQKEGLPVRVQLVGIHFEQTRGFRGKALVQFGPALTLEAYRERHAADPRAATAALTEDLHARLEEMVLTAESQEMVRLADLVERMGVLDAGGDDGLQSAFERKKALLDAYATLKERAPAEIEALRGDLREYRRFLDALGVRDSEIAEDYRVGRVLAYAARNTLALAIGLPVVAAGLAGNFVPYFVAWSCAKFGETMDSRTSAGFIVGVLAFPLWWAGLGYAGWRLAGPWGAAGAAVLAPVCGAFALGWMDRWHRVMRATWGLWTALALRSARAKLRRMRSLILARIQRMIERWRAMDRRPPQDPP